MLSSKMGADFQSKLEKLFNIKHKNAEAMIEIPED